MAASKLFTPALRTKRGTALDSESQQRQFVSPPTHAEIPVFSGPTDKGDPHYPLSLGGDGKASTKPAEKRPYSSLNEASAKY